MTVAIGSKVTWRESDLYRKDGKVTSTIVLRGRFDELVKEDNRKAYRDYMPADAPVAQLVLGREVGEVVTYQSSVFGEVTITIERVEAPS